MQWPNPKPLLRQQSVSALKIRNFDHSGSTSASPTGSDAVPQRVRGLVTLGRYEGHHVKTHFRHGFTLLLRCALDVSEWTARLCQFMLVSRKCLTKWAHCLVAFCYACNTRTLWFVHLIYSTSISAISLHNIGKIDHGGGLRPFN